MRIAETLNEGLKRAYSVTIPAATLAAKVDAQLADVAQKIRMPGFRPGKVPLNLVRKMHGQAMLADAVQNAVNEGVQQLIAEQKLRPAMQPKVDLAALPGEGADMDFTVAVEILPTIEAPQLDGLALEKLVVAPDDTEMDAALTRLADQQKRFEAAPAKHQAALGDVVLIDFTGTVDGEEFDGGKGDNMRVELGAGQLIPGFEDQLVGVAANNQRTVKVSFPGDYHVAYLKGRAAEFTVTVNEVQTAAPTAVDDALATGLGIDSLDALKDILKDQLEAELGSLTRTHLKRKLLDTLAASHDFAVPEAMVDAEFEQIWQQLDREAAQDAEPAAARAAIEAERDDYRRIAERRVRLGLLLSEIGQGNNVQVTQAEMNRLIGQEAAKYPGEQAQVVKFYQENAMAAAQLRAPLYEDKVVDFLIGKAAITERHVTRAELMAEIESDDETPGGHVHGPDCDHGHDHAPAKPKRAAKVTAAPVEDATPTEDAPARPARAKKAAAAVEAAVVGDAVAEDAPAKAKRAKKAVE